MNNQELIILSALGLGALYLMTHRQPAPIYAPPAVQQPAYVPPPQAQAGQPQGPSTVDQVASTVGAIAGAVGDVWDTISGIWD